MIVIKIIILYFIQIRHTDDFPSTGSRLAFIMDPVGPWYSVTSKSQVSPLCTAMQCGSLPGFHGLLCDKEIRRRIAMGKAARGGLTTLMERQGNQACHKSETGEGLGVLNSTVRTGDLDDEKTKN